MRVHPAVGEQGRRDVSVRGTADVVEQAAVVGRLRRRFVDPQPVGEPHPDDRAPQAVLQGQAHPQVRRQRQAAEDLGGTDLSDLLGTGHTRPYSKP